MKSLKALLAELAQPKPEEEKRFKELHNIEKIDYVIPQEHVFSGEIEPQARLADAGDDSTYDSSYDKTKKAAQPIKEGVDGRRKEFKEKLRALLYAKMQKEKKEADSAVVESLTDQLMDLAENPAEEIPMMEKQLAFISYAADEISDYVRKSGDPEEWYQNKLAEAHGSIKSLYAYAQGETNMMSTPAMAEETTPAMAEELPEAIKSFSAHRDEGAFLSEVADIDKDTTDEAILTRAARREQDAKKAAKNKKAKGTAQNEDEVEEDAAAFIFAAAAAKRDGKKKFTFGGKEYPVTIKGDVAKPKT